MAQLVFEIWEDPDSGSQGMYQADPRSDETRRRIEPNAVLIHSFKARSSFEAFRMLYAWNDWGEWQPPPGIEDNIFTDEEEAAQREYLRTRD